MRGRPILLLLPIVLLAGNALGSTVIPDPTKRKGAGPFFRIRRGEKWGYIDRRGKIMIQPRFDEVHDFFHGLAGVRIGEKWGFANEKGKVVIPAHYDRIGDFLEDLAPVRIGRKWGYIDTKGRMVVEPRFQGAGEFHQGLARIYVWDKAVCTRGTFTNEDAPEYAFLLPDWVRVMPGCFPQGGMYGFIDKTGSLAIPPRFSYAQDFSEGLAVVRVEESLDNKFGFIDRTGSLVIAPQFNQANSFSEGLAAVEISARVVGNRVVDIAWGFIDKTGRLVIPPIYQFVGSFSEGLARIGIGSKMGYINAKGEMVIPAKLSSGWDYSEGLAGACEDTCVYIDHSGAPVITGFYALWPFSDRLAVTTPSKSESGQQVYIDKSGHMVAVYESETE